MTTSSKTSKVEKIKRKNTFKNLPRDIQLEITWAWMEKALDKAYKMGKEAGREETVEVKTKHYGAPKSAKST